MLGTPEKKNTETHAHRQTDRQTDRQADTQTHADRQTGRHRHTQTHSSHWSTAVLWGGGGREKELR